MPYTPPSFGTAPHMILPGVWATLSGRRLTDAGNHYWTQQYQLGVTDGKGHYNHQLAATVHQARNAPTLAARQAAGRQYGTYAKAQQDKLQQQGQMGLSMATMGASDVVGALGKDVVRSIQTQHPTAAASKKLGNDWVVNPVKKAVQHPSPGNIVQGALGASMVIPGVGLFGKANRAAKAIHDAAEAEKVADAARLGPLTKEASAEVVEKAIPKAVGHTVTLPKGFPLFHVSYQPDAIIREGFTPSRMGEIGPGVYASPSSTLMAKRYPERTMLHTVPVRNLRLLDRSTPTGEKLYRKLELDNNIEKGGPQGLQHKLQQAGFDGVVHTSPGEPVPEVAIHDPRLLAPAARHVPLTPQASAEASLGKAIPALESKAREQKGVIGYEKAARKAAADKAYQEAGGGTPGLEAWKREMAGPYTHIRFDQMDELTPEQIHHLKTVAFQYTDPVKDPHGYHGPVVANALDKLANKEVLQQGEIAKIKDVFGAKAAEEAATLSKWHKISRFATDLINVPRSLQTTLDLSNFFRQDLLAMAAFPKITSRNIGPAAKALFSNRNAEATWKMIQERPDYEHWVHYKLPLTDLGPLPAFREEHGQSVIAEKLPLIGHVVKGSNRGFTVGQNTTRIEVASAMRDMAGAMGHNIDDPKLNRDIVKVVGILTGRGDLGKKLNDAAPVMNAIFFAPRFMYSRIQVFNPMNYLPARLIGDRALHPVARKILVRSLYRTGIAAATFLAGLHYLGFNVVADPRNPDFGKARFGNTRVDLLGGFGQWLRLAATETTQTTVSSQTGAKRKLGPGFGQVNGLDILEQFFEGKASPPARIAMDMLRHTNFTGQPLTVKQEILSSFVPMLAQDLADIYNKNQGSVLQKAGGVAGAALPGILGMGLQTYPPKAGAAPRVPRDPFGSSGGYSDPFSNTDSGYSDPFATIGP